MADDYKFVVVVKYNQMKKKLLVKYDQRIQDTKIDPENKTESNKQKWLDNKPLYKEGDEVIYLENGIYYKILLKKLERSDLTKNKTYNPLLDILTADYPQPMWQYSWNDYEFFETYQVFDPVKELNSLKSVNDVLNNKIEILEKDSALFNQLKMALAGVLINQTSDED